MKLTATFASSERATLMPIQIIINETQYSAELSGLQDA